MCILFEMLGHIAFEEAKAVIRGKDRRGKTVPRLSSCVHVRLRVPVYSNIRGVDRIRVTNVAFSPESSEEQCSV